MNRAAPLLAIFFALAGSTVLAQSSRLPIIDMHFSEKRDILYNNAARFLRLSQAEIAQHHQM